MTAPANAAQPRSGGVAGIPWRDLVLALAMAVFTFGSALDAVRNTRFGVAPDEWAHATYLHEIANGGRLIPDYAGSRILPTEVRGNYLNHPPLYYTSLGLLGRVLDWDAVEDHRRYRAVSALFVALGVLLWILAGRSLGVSALHLVACTAAINAIPMFPFLAGSINNDNMAYLGVATAVFGVVQLRRWPRAAFYIAALGLAVAALSKATAAVYLAAFFAFWAMPLLRQPDSLLRNRHFLIAVLGAAIACTAYYLPTLILHDTPFPTASELYPSNPPSNPMPLGPFAIEFARQIVPRLPVVTSHASLAPLTGGMSLVFWAMLLLPIAAWAIAWRGTRGDDARLGTAFVLALTVTVAAHLWVVWGLHREAGVVAGMQPRYYSYVLPGIFLFPAIAARGSRSARVLLAAFAVMAACLLASAPALVARMQLRAQVAAEAAANSPQALHYGGAAEIELPVRVGLGSRNVGHLDAIEIGGGSAIVSGWAINGSDMSPAHGILVFVGDRVVGSAETGVPRPDVAQALATPRAARAGFRFTIRGLPAQVSKCDIRLAAEQTDGSLANLPHAACPRPRADSGRPSTDPSRTDQPRTP